MRNLLLILLASTAITGCQSSRWVELDNGAADAAGLQQAQRECRVDEQLAALEQARSDSNQAMRGANTNAAKMVVRDDIQIQERAVYAEIDACMRNQGFKRN